MNLLLTQRPYWVLLALGVALVYAKEDEDSLTINNNSSDNININNSTSDNSVPSALKRPPYHENLLRKSTPTTTTTTSRTTGPSADILASTASLRTSSGSGLADEFTNIGLTREGRIMVGSNVRPNRTGDTTDFARNTVPVKDQTATDPTVAKKTEPPRKLLRKPNSDLKNKLRVDRIRYGGPPGPDASMLAYNAFTPQLTEPTTERHIRPKPFTTKSRPPPLSYLTSTADSPLPPTAWALTTLKGSAPAAAEHVKNTIPATASEPLKGTRPRTTLSSVKPINSFWSTRLQKYPSTASSYEVTETTEPSPGEQKVQETSKMPTTATAEEISKSDDTQLNKISEEKTSMSALKQTPQDHNNSIIVSKIDEEPKIIYNNETQLKIKQIDITSTPKELNQTNNINEIDIKENVQKNITIKTDQLEEINEAIKKTEEENQLTKIVEGKLKIKKPEIIAINNLMNKPEPNVKKVEIINEQNHTTTTTENYSNTLTEKPDPETAAREVKHPEEVSEKPAVLHPVVTESNRIVTDIVHDLEHENNYNTAVYPFGNIINATKFTHKSITDELQPMDLNSPMNITTTEPIKESDEPSVIGNTIISMSSISDDILLMNQSISVVNETNQSTTSMTRATNATQPPVNSTTEPSTVTIMSINKTNNVVVNITEPVAVSATTTPAAVTTTISEDDDIFSTLTFTSDSSQFQTFRNDMSEVSQSNITTVTPNPLTTQSFLIVSAENNETSLLNDTVIDLNITNTDNNVNTSVNLEDNLNKIINLNTTSKENDIKSISIIEPAKNLTKLNIQQSTKELHTLPPIMTTIRSNYLFNNKSLQTLRKHFELNQTNNDIKLGGDLDLPIPTIVSVTQSPSTTRSNYIKTTTEKLITTTKMDIKTDEVPDIFSEPPVTDLNLIKDSLTTIIVESKKNLTNNQYDINNNSDIETTTITPLIIHETDDINDDESIVYNTTGGNDKKFAIETAVNITADHDIDDNVDEVVSGEKYLGELVPDNVNTTGGITEETILTSTPSVPVEIIVTTEVPITTTTSASTTTTPSSTTTIRTTTTAVGVTTSILDEEGVTPGEDGIDVEDYETGVATPMFVRLRVHASYKEMCASKDLLIESIVRLFKTVERDVERRQIKIINLDRECMPPYRNEKGGGVPVHLRISDAQGQYDKRLTEIFETLVSQDSLWFKYQVTHLDDVQESPMDAETQGSGTIIAAIVISSIAGLCLLILTILLIIMRKRQRGFNYGQRCTPVSLDDYSLDNISVYNSVRRKAMRASKRSYGNPAFDDPAAISNSLNFAGLLNVVNDKAKLEDEFSRIPVITVKADELPPGAEVKNRYANVIPLPETRVMLNTPNNNDVDQFINANFVKGAKGCEKFYVACQAPMRDTISDFWQMIWEQQSRIVIMLTDLHENGVEKCADYLPPSEVLDCHRVFGDLQVTLKKREAREKYIISSLQLKNLDSNLWREVTHLWYVGWPGRGVPDDLSSVIAFLIEARSYAKCGPPIVVHCSPGTGRTGTIIAIDIAIRDFETDRVVDIPRTVYNVRRDRAGAVQTNQQYAFIYQVLHLYATKLTGGGLDSI